MHKTQKIVMHPGLCPALVSQRRIRVEVSEFNSSEYVYQYYRHSNNSEDFVKTPEQSSSLGVNHEGAQVEQRPPQGFQLLMAT